MFKLTICFETAEALRAYLDKNYPDVPPASEPAKTPRKSKPAKTVEAPPEVVEPAPTTAPAYEQVKGAGLKLYNLKGKDQLTAVLARHGLKSAQNAKPEQYAALIKDFELAIDGKDFNGVVEESLV